MSTTCPPPAADVARQDAAAPPPRPRRRRPPLLALAAVVGALVLATASTEDDEPARVDETGGTAEGADAGAGAGPEVFAVGDLVELGDWRVRVHGVTDPLQSTNPVITPAPGNRWVAADVEVTNTGSEPQVVSSLVCFEVVDDRNRSYTLALTADAASSPPDGEVAAGAARRGMLTYEVPADAAGLRLNFACDLFSTGSATIALG